MSISGAPRFSQLTKIPWSEAQKTLYKGRQITCAYSGSDIVVYQAYNKEIAQHAVEHQTFEGCPKFDMRRMTWIKPNFLWMMYRCEWATKDVNQQHVLALFVNRDDFENLILRNGVLTFNPFASDCFDPNWMYYSSQEEWEKEAKQAKNSENRIRVQWDPYHHPSGNKLGETRAIQIGIKGSFLPSSLLSCVSKIEDITHFVREQNELRLAGGDVLIPVETVYHVQDDNIAKKLTIQKAVAQQEQ